MYVLNVTYYANLFYCMHTLLLVCVSLKYDIFLYVIIIIEHLLRRISLTVHQSLCRFTLIDMIINRRINVSMLKT